MDLIVGGRQLEVAQHLSGAWHAAAVQHPDMVDVEHRLGELHMVHGPLFGDVGAAPEVLAEPVKPRRRRGVGGHVAGEGPEQAVGLGDVAHV